MVKRQNYFRSCFHRKAISHKVIGIIEFHVMAMEKCQLSTDDGLKLVCDAYG